MWLSKAPGVCLASTPCPRPGCSLGRTRSASPAAEFWKPMKLCTSRPYPVQKPLRALLAPGRGPDGIGDGKRCRAPGLGPSPPVRPGTQEASWPRWSGARGLHRATRRAHGSLVCLCPAGQPQPRELPVTGQVAGVWKAGYGAHPAVLLAQSRLGWALGCARTLHLASCHFSPSAGLGRFLLFIQTLPIYCGSASALGMGVVVGSFPRSAWTSLPPLPRGLLDSQ